MKKIIAILMLICVVFCSACSKRVVEKTPEERIQEARKDQETTYRITLLEKVPIEQQGKEHPAADSFEGGSGTKEDPYQIADADQLMLLSNLVNDDEYHPDNQKYAKAHYVLINDIDFNDVSDYENWKEKGPEYNWIPIGVNTIDTPNGTKICKESGFYGSFNGAGHIIRGLYIASAAIPTGEASNMPVYGLFGNVFGGEEQVIQNITIEKSLYKIYNVGYYIGGIVGQMHGGAIKNCNSKVDIICGGSNSLGGIVGETLETDIENCEFSGSLSGQGTIYNMGGIAARDSGGNLSNCINSGELIPAHSTLIGGIVSEYIDSFESATMIDHCVNKSNLMSGGGITGQLLTFRHKVSITDCINEGEIGLDNDISVTGGIVGRLAMYGTGENISNVEFNKCSNKGKIDGSAMGRSIGGLIGTIALNDGVKLTIEECENTGIIKGESNIGGLIGVLVDYGEGEYSILNCINKGQVIGRSLGIGGILGLSQGTAGTKILIQNCYNYEDISGSGYGVGGIVGSFLNKSYQKGTSIKISDCENEGTITGDIGTLIGGVLGYVDSGEENIEIDSCMNSGVLVISNAINSVDTSSNGILGIAGGIVGCAKKNGVTFTGDNKNNVTVDNQSKVKILFNDIVGYLYEEEPILGTGDLGGE